MEAKLCWFSQIFQYLLLISTANNNCVDKIETRGKCGRKDPQAEGYYFWRLLKMHYQNVINGLL